MGRILATPTGAVKVEFVVSSTAGKDTGSLSFARMRESHLSRSRFKTLANGIPAFAGTPVDSKGR